MKRKHTSEYILRTIMHVTDQKRKIEEVPPADTLKVSPVHHGQQLLCHVIMHSLAQAHERGVPMMTCDADLTGETDPARMFSLRGLDMQERSSMVGESGMTVLDELETSVKERR